MQFLALDGNSLSKCIRNSFYQEVFKRTKVFPLFTNCEPDKGEIYIPLSVIETLSYEIEKIIQNSPITCMEGNQLLNNNKLSFRTESSPCPLLSMALDLLNKLEH